MTWRVLLAVALVVNPLAGANPAVAATTAATDTEMAAGAAMPPCHAMAAHHDAETQAGDPVPDRQHGCDCGNAACQFACCAAIVFAVPSPRLAPLAHAQAPSAPDSSETAPPPRLRMIRPPIP